MSDSMRIKIKRKFTNPLTGRRAQIDEEFNVPKNQFWFKRILEKDCELLKSKAKAKKPQMVNADENKNLKGSK